MKIVISLLMVLLSLQAEEIIHGHRLPPEPDPKINNSTLLGTDSNNNGIRDDVERWIYKRYDSYCPCEKGIIKVVMNGKEVLYYKGVAVENFNISCSDIPTKYHPVYVDIALQTARGYQLILEHAEQAKEIDHIVSAFIACESYYMTYAKYFNEPILVEERIDDKVFTRVFNTKEREERFHVYDSLLSGSVIGTGKVGEGKNLCDFNTSKYENEDDLSK